MIRIAMTAALLGTALAATGSTAQTGMEARQEAWLAKALEGLTPGAPAHCIDRDKVNYIETFQDTIVYVQGRNKVWRNTINGGCDGLRRGDIVVTRSLSNQICSGDHVETRSHTGGMMTGACALGDFVPYSK